MSVRVHWLEETTSTQDAAHELAAAGAAEGTAVAAVMQRGGRGSRGRAWLSPAGGLWMSVVCRPESAVPQVASLRIALAVAEVLGAAGFPDIRLKWPNDLILADRKLGGVLVEARWSGDALAWVVAGVGVNVWNSIPAELREQAIALCERGAAPRPERLAEPVARAVAAACARRGPLDRAELAAFQQRDWLSGRTVVTPVAGRATGIGPEGELHVRDDEGMLHLVRNGPVSAESPTLHR